MINVCKSRYEACRVVGDNGNYYYYRFSSEI